MTFSVAITLIMQCLGCLDQALFRYEEMTTLLRIRGNKAALNNLASTISRGLSLTELITLANDMFGTIIVAEYGFNFWSATLGTYLSFTLINVYDSELGRINELVLMFGSGMMVMSLFSIFRIYIMQAKGQDLSNRCSTIKRNLKAVLINTAGSLDAAEERRLEALIADVSEINNGIRPCDIFDMDTGW